jgi:hypothetical protein
MPSALPPLAKRQFVLRGAVTGVARISFHLLAIAQKQKAPGVASEGFRVSSGDRGDRSPVAGGRSAGQAESFVRGSRARDRIAQELRGHAVVGGVAKG